MLWFFLALTTAFCTAVGDTISKRFFSDLTPYEMAIIRFAYAFPYLAIGLITLPWPELDTTFWVCLAVGLPLELCALLSYMNAIKSSPLSLTVPFLAFTPAFVMITGYIILGERLHVWGIMGIFLIIIGAYLLNLSRIKVEWLAPFKAIIKEPGSRYMLLTSFIYSLTAINGKLAILHSSPQFFAVSYFFFFSFSICLVSHDSRDNL
ncbi:MAG: DMT family transporter [Deltaproteobacteria bacterium]|nr:DMT family transporter [Deltaproteobacteria bacterium]